MGVEIASLMESREFLSFLFDNLTSAIFLVDKSGRVQMVNNAFRSLFAKDERQFYHVMCGNALGCVFAVDEEAICGNASRCDECEIRRIMTQSFQGAENPFTAHIERVFYINGKPVLKHFQIKSRCLVYREQEMAVMVVDDVTELEQQKERLREMAVRDELTGLFNRRYFAEAGVTLLENAKRRNLTVAVVMMDIDHFKGVNDTYGHDAGDRVIQRVASIIRSNARNADVVARWGGEEFCLMLTAVKTARAFDAVERMRRRVESESVAFGDHRIRVTVSCGLTTQLAASLEEMIKAADRMLYQAKRRGRNRTVMQAPAP